MDQQSSFPGTRRATRQDVPQASDLPDAVFLSDFKEALLAHSDSHGVRRRQSDQSAALLRSSNGGDTLFSPSPAFTYPLSLLASFPNLPPQHEIAQLRVSFTARFQKDAFLNGANIQEDSLLPPYLQMAIACLGDIPAQGSLLDTTYNTISSTSPSPSDTLFYGGYQLSSFMTETDNRHIMTLELPLSLVLLATYGMLTADSPKWDLAASVFTYGLTMVRRQGIFDRRGRMKTTSEQGRTRSIASLAHYYLLIDTIRAIHCGSEALLSPAELSTTMQAAGRVGFGDLYAQLFMTTMGLKHVITTNEDGLLLLVALLSEYLLVRRIHSPLTNARAVDPHSSSRDNDNPFIPLSPMMERVRLLRRISEALDRWHEIFNGKVTEDVLALYNYLQLIMILPQTLDLPAQAGYPPAALRRMNVDVMNETIVSDEAHGLAWRILDRSAASTSVSVWLAPITFQAALVVWQKLKVTAQGGFGSLRVLDSFANTLGLMSWPCCRTMVATLNNLPKILEKRDS